MKIIIVDNQQLREYTKKIANALTFAGYSVEQVDVSTYTGNQSVTSVPTFFVQKDEKVAYALKGKQPLGEVLNWANNSGAKDN